PSNARQSSGSERPGPGPRGWKIARAPSARARSPKNIASSQRPPEKRPKHSGYWRRKRGRPVTGIGRRSRHSGRNRSGSDAPPRVVRQLFSGHRRHQVVGGEQVGAVLGGQNRKGL